MFSSLIVYQRMWWCYSPGHSRRRGRVIDRAVLFWRICHKEGIPCSIQPHWCKYCISGNCELHWIKITQMYSKQSKHVNVHSKKTFIEGMGFAYNVESICKSLSWQPNAETTSLFGTLKNTFFKGFQRSISRFAI